VQSGSDRVLKLMNREYTAGSYIEFIDRVRQYLPDATLASDFIVGFPTETEEDYEKTCELIRRCAFKNSFIFKYSPRPGTPAATMADQIAPDVMDDRLQRLQAALNRDQQAFNANTVGRSCDVLIERAGKLPGQMLGKSPWLQSVHLTTDAAVGDLVRVDLTRADPNSMAGVAHMAQAA